MGSAIEKLHFAYFNLDNNALRSNFGSFIEIVSHLTFLLENYYSRKLRYLLPDISLLRGTDITSGGKHEGHPKRQTRINKDV